MIVFTSILNFFLSTMVPIWSSCRFHFPFLTSPSLSSFSFSCWAHLLHFWQAQFNNKYIRPMWWFFLFLFPPCPSHGGFCKCFITTLALFCVLFTFLFFAIDFVVFFFSLSFFKSTSYLPSQLKCVVSYALNILLILNWSFFLLWVFQWCHNQHLFFYKTLFFVECFHFIALVFALIGWLLFMSRVKLSLLYLLMSLESRMSQRNACVQCLISI